MSRPKGYESDAEFDERQTEIRHQAELTHRAHPEGVEEGYKVGCLICFEDYVDSWGR